MDDCSGEVLSQSQFSADSDLGGQRYTEVEHKDLITPYIVTVYASSGRISDDFRLIFEDRLIMSI